MKIYSKIFILLFLILPHCSKQVASQNDKYIKVYIPQSKDSEVLYDTDTKKSQVLIKDSTSVFFVMSTSRNYEWVILSKMPADPEETHGTNEKILLMYIPQKRIICHPTFGNNASAVSLDTIKHVECVTWYSEDSEDTTTLKMLEKICIRSPKNCNCTSE
jgi:hypothetical protein